MSADAIGIVGGFGFIIWIAVVELRRSIRAATNEVNAKLEFISQRLRSMDERDHKASMRSDCGM